MAVVKLPDAVGFEVGAATLLTYATTLHALADRAAIQKGETLLVLGAAGGVGIAAVELGKLMGARVIAAASSDEKLAFCREHGATDVINYTTEDLKDRLKALTKGNGVDVVYDPVGGAYTEAALRGTAWGALLRRRLRVGRHSKDPAQPRVAQGSVIKGFRAADVHAVRTRGTRSGTARAA